MLALIELHRHRHVQQADAEVALLKIQVQDLESLAIEYVPLDKEQTLEKFGVCKDDILNFQKRQKQRRRKESLRTSRLELPAA